MSRRKWYAVGAVAVVAALALGLAFGLGGGQQQSAPLAQGGLPPAGGLNEGIQVHGHWTLEVREPDGSLVSRQEFENDFIGQGNLYKLISGEETLGPWGIRLSLPPDNYGGPFFNSSYGADFGYIEEPCTNSSYFNYFYNLGVSPDPQWDLILTGYAVAQTAGNISEVYTYFHTCTNTTSPAQCNCTNQNPNWMLALTAANLYPDVQLIANQSVHVTVDIAFD